MRPQLPLSANGDSTQVAYIPQAATANITVTVTGPVTLPAPGLYRVFADTAGCDINGMPLAVGAEYFMIESTSVTVTVAVGAKVVLTRV